MNKVNDENQLAKENNNDNNNMVQTEKQPIKENQDNKETNNNKDNDSSYDSEGYDKDGYNKEGINKKGEKRKEEEIETFPAVNYFKLQFTYASCLDILFIIIGTIGAMGMGAAFPLFATTFGDILNDFGDPSGDSTALISSIGDLSLQMLYIGFGFGGGTFLQIYFFSEAGTNIANRIKVEYFRILLKQDQTFFDKSNPYEFSTKVQTQIKVMKEGVGVKIGSIIMACSMFIGAYIVGFLTSWKLSLILFSIVPLMLIFGYLMSKMLIESNSKSREHYQKAGGVAEENLYNVKLVTSFSNYEFEHNRFNKELENSYEVAKNGNNKSSMVMGVVFFLIFAAYALAIGVGGKFIADGEINGNTGEKFRAGDILIVIFTIVFGSFSLGQASPNFKSVAAACASAGEFFHYRDLTIEREKYEKTLKQLKPSKEEMKGSLKFNDVNFTYASLNRKVLNNLNMEFEQGKTTAIVGESGSGKSTIVNMLVKLYDPNEGSITLDGTDIKQINTDYFRSLCGYVQQEPILFNQSIKDNIIFGREGITDDQFEEACKKSLVSQFIKKKGEDFKVGVKGSKLSGGMKQRVAIARAILTNPKFLILDEATSALDYKSEKIVKKALDQVSQGVTTIVIAHRLSTVRNADKIIVLSRFTENKLNNVNENEIDKNIDSNNKDSNIAEVGNHESLYDLKGLYYNLVKNQEKSQQNQVEKTEEEDKEIKEVDEDLIVKEGDENQNENLTFKERKQKLLENEKEKDKKIEEQKKKLWPLICEEPSTVAFASICASINGIVWPSYGLLLAEAIFRLSDTSDSEKLKDNSLFLAMMFLLVAFISGFANYATGFLFSRLGEKLAKSLRARLFVKFLQMHMAFFDHADNSPGSLVTRLASDTTKVNGIALSMCSVLVETIATLLVGIVLSFVFAWQLALLCLGFIPFIIMCAAVNMKLNMGLSKEDEVKDKSLGTILSECVNNTKSIFCYNFQENAVELYSEKVNEGEVGICNKLCNSAIAGFSQFLMFGIYAITFYVGSVLIDKGHIENFKYMMYSIFSILFASFGLGMAQQYVGDYGESKEALYNIFRILETESTIDPTNDDAKLIKPNNDTFKGAIEFKNVHFAYPSKKTHKIFTNLNLLIEAGKSCAFVGFSGSGKSTIIQLCLRFYDIDQGQILIDNVDIKDYDIKELRNCMGLVMQEPALFNRSIYENIKYGNLKANQEQVLEAARKSLVPRVEELLENKKISSKTSGGEKQRIAIARTMLKDPKILFLDEATSAIDKKNEEGVQQSLDILMKGRTSISIAHRLSTIVNSDVIYFLNGNGQIVEQGTHDELMNKKGYYYDLYQSGTSK